MNSPRTCPTCRAPIPADAPEGLCPHCLAHHVYTASPSASPAAATGPELDELSSLLPDFELEEVLGQGGMGVVYRARQRRLDRPVAIKVLSPELGRDPAFAERFAREARALARMNHPGVVSVYDFGQAGPYCYLVMELVDGANLRQVIEAGEFTPTQALAIVPQLCEALQFAHDEGLVHRDIKPENILLDRKGRVRIADFGLAKMVEPGVESVTLTGSGQVMGTPKYMAPEQVERPQEVDHRADIYSLGVVFYEMLTGELPLGRFAPPSAKASVDGRLDEVVLRTLEKEPRQRYQNASEIKQDVETIGSEEAPAVERPRPEPIPAAVPASRSRKLSGMAIASCLCAVLPLPMFALFTFVFLFADSGGGGSSGPGPMGHEGPMPSEGMGVGLVPFLVVPIPLFLIGLCCSIGFGWAAIQRIRRQWPALWGMGAAVVGAFLWPMLIVDVLVVSIVVAALSAIGEFDDGIVLLALTLGLLLADVFFLIWMRVALLPDRAAAGRA